MIIGLRVNAHEIPVPTATDSVDAASHIAWVSELRKSSIAQTPSMPAASAARACSASSPVESPSPAIWTRSRAAARAIARSAAPHGSAGAAGLSCRPRIPSIRIAWRACSPRANGFTDPALWASKRGVRLDLVDPLLNRVHDRLDLVLVTRGRAQCGDPVDLLLKRRDDRLGELLQRGAGRRFDGGEDLAGSRGGGLVARPAERVGSADELHLRERRARRRASMSHRRPRSRRSRGRRPSRGGRVTGAGGSRGSGTSADREADSAI